VSIFNEGGNPDKPLEHIYNSLWMLTEADKDETTTEEPTETTDALETDSTDTTATPETDTNSTDTGTEGDVTDGTGSEEVNDDNGGVVDLDDAEETQSEKNKKLILFDNYRNIYNSINNFIENLDKYKEHLNQKDESLSTLDFIEDKLYNLRENVKGMITEKILTLSYEKSRVIFIHVKTEINLMIKLFEKISTKEQ